MAPNVAASAANGRNGRPGASESITITAPASGNARG